MKRGKSKRTGGKAIWSQNQKLEAVCTYVMLGNMAEACRVTGIPLQTMKCWKHTDWFKDLMVQVRQEDVQQLDANLQRVITKALKATEDRLDAGDYQYDPKTGKVIRIPLKAHTALKITTELLTKQDKIRDKPQQAEVEKTIDARLAKLSEEFSKFASSRVIEASYEVIESTPIPRPTYEASVTI